MRILCVKLRISLTNFYLYGAVFLTLVLNLFVLFRRMGGTPEGILGLCCGGWLMAPITVAVWLMVVFAEELTRRHVAQELTFGTGRFALAAAYLSSCITVTLITTAVTVAVPVVLTGADFEFALRIYLWQSAILICAALVCMVFMLLLRSSVAAMIPPAVMVMMWSRLGAAGISASQAILSGDGICQILLPFLALSLSAALLFVFIFARCEWR